MYYAKAPGKLFLFGEYAVLHGEYAIVCPVPYFIHVQLTPRDDDKISIDSNIGQFSTDLAHLELLDSRFDFVIAVIQQWRPLFKQGLSLQITSEFSSTVGFGSSGAVIAAVAKALNQWLPQANDLLELFKIAKKALLAVQKKGSGADVATSLFAQTIAFRSEPLEIIPLQHEPPLIAKYSGYKTATVDAIDQIAKKMQADPNKYPKIYSAIGKCSQQAIIAINQADWPQVAVLMRENQRYLNDLGVNDATMQQLIDELQAQPDILAAKISGSGLGDCVVGLCKHKK